MIQGALTALSGVFVTVINRSVIAGGMVLVILVVRLLLKKAPKWVSCLLWGLVAVELMGPLPVSSPFSVFHAPVFHRQVVVTAEQGKTVEFFHYNGSTEKPEASIDLSPFPGSPDNRPDLTEPTHTSRVYLPDLVLVWLLGVGAMAIYGASSYGSLRRRTSASLLQSDGVYCCDDIDTPFILGVVRPKIYLPSCLEGTVRGSVVAHEQAHLQRRDHWWKPLGFVLLTVYWFQPLLWVAYSLLCRDIELACDERVCREMSAGQRKEYAQALLTCSVPHGVMTAVSPLAFGEVGVKQRVRAVADYRKPTLWMAILGAAVCAGVALCFLTVPGEKNLGQWMRPEIVQHGWNCDMVRESNGEGFQVTLCSEQWAESFPDAVVGEVRLYANRGQFVLWNWDETPQVLERGSYHRDWLSFGGVETYEMTTEKGEKGICTVSKTVYLDEQAVLIAEKAGVEVHSDPEAKKYDWTLVLRLGEGDNTRTYQFTGNNAAVSPAEQENAESTSAMDLGLAPMMVKQHFEESRLLSHDEAYGVSFHYLVHGDLPNMTRYADGTAIRTIYGLVTVLSCANVKSEVVYVGPVRMDVLENSVGQAVLLDYWSNQEASDGMIYGNQPIPAEIQRMIDGFDSWDRLYERAIEDGMEGIAE